MPKRNGKGVHVHSKCYDTNPMSSKEDLSKVDPSGRLDVLVYRLGQRLIEGLEKKQGLQGIWQNAEPHIQDLIKEYMPVSLPKEVTSLLKVIELNTRAKI